MCAEIKRGDIKELFQSLRGDLVMEGIAHLARRSGYTRKTWYTVINSGFLIQNADGSIPVGRAQTAMENYRASLRARRRAVSLHRREVTA